ncbi:MAG TPA: RsmD family RNA methyltransferase, partial [Rhizomicrobium sp.]
ESRALIRRNVEALQLTGITKIWRRDATQLGPMPAGSGGPFSLVFLDPPYRKNLVAPAMQSLAEGKWFTTNVLLVTEMAADEPLPSPPGFALLDERTYGDTRVSFWCTAI